MGKTMVVEAGGCIPRPGRSDQAYPCQISPQGSLLFRANSSEERSVNAAGVPIFGGSYGNSGPRGNGYIRPPPT